MTGACLRNSHFKARQDVATQGKLVLANERPPTLPLAGRRCLLEPSSRWWKGIFYPGGAGTNAALVATKISV